MLASMTSARKLAARLFAITSLLWLAACSGLPTIPTGSNTGQTIDTSRPVQVALLVPGGSGAGSDQFLADNLENAARLAVADLNGVEIDLRVYNTGSDVTQAAQVATLAANDGAKVILGPLFADAANAAGLAVAGRNINVLAFSNNPTIAGGNVFVLGNTFDNTANRIVNYATRKGVSRIGILHSNDAQGIVGRDSISRAVSRNGATLAGVQAYDRSQDGILSATNRAVTAFKQAGADGVFLTADAGPEVAFIGTTLPEAGLNPADVQYMGLTRWNAAPETLATPGLQNGLFALPDTGRLANFEARYSATYGNTPHPLAGLAYDGVAAVGALAASGNPNALTKDGLTARQGFQGTSGIFRLLPNGLNEKGLAVATVRNGSVVILERAPISFGGGS